MYGHGSGAGPGIGLSKLKRGAAVYEQPRLPDRTAELHYAGWLRPSDGERPGPPPDFNGASASEPSLDAPAQGGGTYQDYQRQQIQRLTDQAQQQQPLTRYRRAAAADAQMQDTYGPYVPYVPPIQSYGYTPSPVSVQLGDSTPRIAPPQREVTDVLPTAKYVPNARASHSNSRVRTGVSKPPPDDSITMSTQNAQYRPQIDVQPQASAAMQGQSYPTCLQPIRPARAVTATASSIQNPAR